MAKPKSSAAGALLLSEIREQPDALRRLAGQRKAIAKLVKKIERYQPQMVRLVAHGSSDNAASYGVYSFGLMPALTCFRDSISLNLYYGAQLRLDKSLVVAVSQSGRTPDVVEFLADAKRRGALTLGITNDPESSLAEIADLVLPLEAGPERAVAATKTYTNTLAALALLAGGVAGIGDLIADRIESLADSMEQFLPEHEQGAEEVAAALHDVERMFVVGRGAEYATARGVALKVKETCQVVSESLTSTDLAHGPVAAAGGLCPVWTIACYDPNLPAAIEAAKRAVAAGAPVMASGSAARLLPNATWQLPTPAVPDPVLSPILSVIPGQLFARALSLSKGLNPDAPEGLNKITAVP